MANKRKNKKRAANQGTVNSTSQSEETAQSLSNKENVEPTVEATADDAPPTLSSSPPKDSVAIALENIPAGGPVGIGAKGAVPGNIVEDTKVVKSATPLPDFVQTSIDSAVRSRVIDVDAITALIRKKVSNGDYAEKRNFEAKTSEKIQQQAGTSESAVKTSSDTNLPKTTDVSLGAPIATEGASGLAPPSGSENLPVSVDEKVKETSPSDLPVEDSGTLNATDVPSTNEGVPVVAPTSNATPTALSTSGPTNPPVPVASKLTSAPLKNATAAVVSGGAGAAAAIVGATKVQKGNHRDGLSESVKHGIKSVVDSKAVDVDKIVNSKKSDQPKVQPVVQKEPSAAAQKSSQDVKRPEAAAGDTNKPAMPSSTKAADTLTPATQAKSKSSEHRQSFLKKKNCIIL